MSELRFAAPQVYAATSAISPTSSTSWFNPPPSDPPPTLQPLQTPSASQLYMNLTN